MQNIHGADLRVFHADWRWILDTIVFSRSFEIANEEKQVRVHWKIVAKFAQNIVFVLDKKCKIIIGSSNTCFIKGEHTGSLGPWSKTNLPFEWDSVSLGFKPPPLAKWDAWNFGLFVSNFVPCERWIKIKVVSEEKMTKSFYLVNKNLYSIKRDYISFSYLEKLKSLP